MALKYPDRLEANNPAAYGIVKAIEVAGHKTVATVADLYALADPILSDSKSNTNNDAIGQEWYVRDQACFYRLINWANRKQASGWQKINTDIELVEKIDNHINDKDNPHEVTKAQVGLGNVDNTADIDKPVSTAVQEQLDTKFGNATIAHGTATATVTYKDKDNGTTLDTVQINAATTSNAGLLTAADKVKVDKIESKVGEITKSDTATSNTLTFKNETNGTTLETITFNSASSTNSGLLSAIDKAKLDTFSSGGGSDYVRVDSKGQPNGVASLDDNGQVPAAQLPSYVDDVLEFTNLAAFPETGEDGKIYVAEDTNLTYRWSGTQYVEISKSLALGETSSTAYAGDKGKANRTAIESLPSNIIIGHGGFTANETNVSTSIQYVSKSGLNYGTQQVLNHNIPTATKTTAGVLSAADKTKLDAIKDTNLVVHLPKEGGMYQTYDEMLAAVNAESELTDDTIAGYGINQASKVMTVTYLDDRWNNLVKATIIQTVAGGMVQQYWFDPFQIQIRERKYPFSSNQWTDLVVMTPGVYGDGTRAGLMTPEDKEKLDLIDFNTTVNGASGAVTATIEPNDFVIFGECTSLNVTLASDLEGKTSEYTFQFTSGDQSTVLTLPTNIQWIGSNQILPNTTYQVSIQNNIAVMGGL